MRINPNDVSELVIVSQNVRLANLIEKKAKENPSLINSVFVSPSLDEFESDRVIIKASSIIIIDGLLVNEPKSVWVVSGMAKTYPVIIVKNIYKPEEVFHLLKLGVKGLTSIGVFYTRFESVVTSVLKDEIFLSEDEIGHLFSHVRASLDTSELTSREKEILPHILNGHTYVEVAKNLNISYETIKSHMKSIYKKLNVRKKSDLLKYDYQINEEI